jgi:N-acetylneuraminic acid mutarotase
VIFLMTSLALHLSWNACAPLPEPRAALILADVDGKLLAAGGTYWSEGRKMWSRRADFFDPASNRWLPGPPLPAPRADSAVAAIEGDVYLLGGTSDGEVLDDVIVLHNGAWETKPEMRLPGKRSYANAAVYNGKLYLFGGMEKAGDLSTIRDNVWVWEDGRWTQIATIPPPARSNYAFAVDGHTAYFFGGVTATTDGFHNLGEALAYDMGANRWRELASVPEANRAWGAVPVRGRILLLGGYTSGFAAGIFRFDPITCSYAYAGELPQGLADTRYVRIGGRIYVTGGESGVKIRSGNTWEGVIP